MTKEKLAEPMNETPDHIAPHISAEQYQKVYNDSLKNPEPEKADGRWVLVTGGAGLIGSHVAKHCLDLGFKVVVMDDLSGGFEDQIPVGCIFINHSVNEVQVVDQLFEKYKFHAVYGLHAYAAENLSHFVRRFNYTNNVISTMNLINAAVNNETKVFIFSSSIAVYGDRTPPFSEDEPVTPTDPYAIGKWAVECDLRAAREMFGMNYVIFRAGNVYGEHQNLGDKYRNVIGIFMNQIMQGKPLTVFGNGTQTRAFSYIDDVAPHIAKSALMPYIWNTTFNIGGNKHYSINDLIKVIAEEFGVEPEIKYLEARQETHAAYSNVEKAMSVFGPPWTDLRLGVRKMAEWAKRVGARQSQEFKDIEIRKNLPEGW